MNAGGEATVYCGASRRLSKMAAAAIFQTVGKAGVTIPVRLVKDPRCPRCACLKKDAERTG